MHEITTRGGLAEAAHEFSGDTLTATVSRREIEEVLGFEGDPELILDVAYSDNEARRVAIAWDRADLSTLLEQGEYVDLTVSRDSLDRAFAEGDFEAHGMREKMLIFTVAAAAAAATASAAQANVADSAGVGGTTSSAIQYSSIENARGVAATNVGGGAVTPEETAPISYSVENAPLAYAIEDVRADQPAPGDAAPLAYAIEDVRADQPATGDAAPTAYAIEDVRGDQPFAMDNPVSDSSGGFEVTAPSPGETAGIAGVIALAITGAAFMVRGRRRIGGPGPA